MHITRPIFPPMETLVELESSPRTQQRLISIDLLRGLVMALMAVDHVRDFVAPTNFDPLDLERTTAGFFLTRWATHFCAPIFVLLAGVGAGLWARRVQDPAKVRRFLLSRGLWLIAVELLLVNPLWVWSLVPTTGYFVILQVIWAIGCSMIFLAGVLFLGARGVGALGLLIVVGHHLLDGIGLAGPSGSSGPLARFWQLLHEPGGFVLAGQWVQVVYPLLPWLGVICLGWSLAPHMALEPARRDQICRRLGLSLVLGFVLLRASNLYGDPVPWQIQERGILFSCFSFLNCTKYPASLLYLMMTLGPALLLLPWLQRRDGVLWHCFVSLGRVPLFYYVLHLALISVAGAVFAKSQGLPIGFWSQPLERFENYEPSLPLVWALSAAIVLALYPACRWFGRIKRERSNWWLRYL